MKRLFFFMYDGNDIYNAFKLSSVANSYFSAWILGKVTLDFSEGYKKLSDQKKLAHLKTFAERCFFGVPVSQWNEWAIRGMSETDFKALGFTKHVHQTVRELLFEGKYAEIQIKLRKVRTLERLTKGWSFERIYMEDFQRAYNFDRQSGFRLREFFSKLFPGLNFEEIIYLAYMQDKYKVF